MLEFMSQVIVLNGHNISLVFSWVKKYLHVFKQKTTSIPYEKLTVKQI